MNKTSDALLAGLAAIIGLATLAVLVSNQANTTNVIKSAASGLANILTVVLSPITGAQNQGPLDNVYGTGSASINGG